MPSITPIPSTPSDIRDFLSKLESRFLAHKQRHPGIDWQCVLEKLRLQPDRIIALQRMEATGGQPDVTAFDQDLNLFVFMDCAPESPKGRRSLCFDDKALHERKEHPPKGSAAGIAQAMGVELLTEKDYRHLQTLGAFDTKTSSWIQTPEPIRSLGGALFGDCRYGSVFVYHNGAGSYYAARGFRAMLTT